MSKGPVKGAEFWRSVVVYKLGCCHRSVTRINHNPLG
jgi:hypothetical protein